MMVSIGQSVGKSGVNRPEDVKRIQILINANLNKLVPLAPLEPDGQAGPKTINAIEEFQRRVVKTQRADGRVDPSGQTLAALNQASQVTIKDLTDLESVLIDLKTEASNFGMRFIKDGPVRQGYIRETQFASKVLREEFAAGRLSAREAAIEAQKVRNGLLEASRIQSSDIGKAYAESLKQTGRSLPFLESKYAGKLFEQSFEKLSTPQKNRVWLEIVESAGRPDPAMSLKAARFAKLGKGLVFVSVGFAVYNVATAENKSQQAAKEVVTGGAGFLAGAAGGAAAGLVCGPGAPVCVGVGVFVGGALGALGADFTFDWLTK